jgi:hypothetical protein
MGRARRSPRQARARILAHLEDFDRQLDLLEHGMEAFDEHFDIKEFKRAFEGGSGITSALRVQAVERSFSRVQNYMGQLALDGTLLAGLELPRIHEGEVARAFEALKQEKVITASLCRHLKDAQKARAAIEHDYVGLAAGDVHRAVKTVAKAAPEFIGRYTPWIKPYL